MPLKVAFWSLQQMPVASRVMGNVEAISTAAHQLLLTDNQSEKQNIASLPIAVLMQMLQTSFKLLHQAL